MLKSDHEKKDKWGLKGRKRDSQYSPISNFLSFQRLTGEMRPSRQED
jgi:hypothetical protein